MQSNKKSAHPPSNESRELEYQLSLVPYLMERLKKFEQQAAGILSDNLELSQEILFSMDTILSVHAWMDSPEMRIKIEEAVLRVLPQVQSLRSWLASYLDFIHEMQAVLHRTDEKIFTFMTVVGALGKYST
ncbi:hypothetical protein CSKR_202917 [Clonorchis sinensis]|uniref:Uncharacterized protein n=1 Tax=Clonorchis sinensis TaxID=79923 RepID=A0A8T1M3P8_CLOSI|nr:hypothetical protein CSKR_202917 [Clonorchis sinensis]